MKQPEVVVAGHICLDMIPCFPASSNFHELLIPGHLLEIGPAVVSTGGPVSNTGLALHKLGVRTRLMAKVGDDIFGSATLKLVRSFDPELVTGLRVVVGEQSSYSVILSLPDADRIVLHSPGPNSSFSADDLRYDLLRPARLFHFGYPPMLRRMYEDGGVELAALLNRVRQEGLATSLDMIMPDPASGAAQADWREILARGLPHVDFFLPSVGEMLFMLDRRLFQELTAPSTEDALLSHLRPSHFSHLAEELLQLGCGVVALKAGHLGLYLRTGGAAKLSPLLCGDWANRELWVPCFKTRVVGTTGSGDATIAGFLTGVLRGLDPVQTLTGAVAVGACNVEAADALGGIIPWDQVQRRIQEGWKRLPLAIESDGWVWEEQNGVWIGPHDGETLNR